MTMKSGIKTKSLPCSRFQLLVTDSPRRRHSAEDSPMSKVLARLNVTDVPSDTLAALATSTVTSSSDDNIAQTSGSTSSGYDTFDSVATTHSTSSDDSDAVSVVTGIPSLSIGSNSHMQTDV